MNPLPSTAAAALGFTLLELLITVTVLAILIALAFPSFSAMVARNQISAAGNDLVAALQFARHEAVRRNEAVQFCGSENGLVCSTTGWQRWIVRTQSGAVLRGGNFPQNVAALPEGIFNRGVQFDSRGLFHGRENLEREGRLILCSPNTDRRLQLEASGGIRLQLVAKVAENCA